MEPPSGSPSVSSNTKQSFSVLELPLKQPTVFLLRHGPRPLCAFEDDVLLTEEGVLHAIELGKFLKDLGLEPGTLVSSPYKRCQETLKNIIKGWEVDPDRYLIANDVNLGDRETKYSIIKDIVQKTLSSSTSTTSNSSSNNNNNRLHLICSHDIMIGDCIRTLFHDLTNAHIGSHLPRYLEGIIWTDKFVIWNGNQVNL